MEVSNVSPTKTPGLEDMAPQFQEVPYRWVIIILYSLLAILIGIITVVLSPISTKIVAIYGVSDFTINATAMAYSLIFAVAGIPANYFIDDHGLRIGILIGCGFQSVGAALQMCVNISFYYMVAGCVLVAIAQPFLLNCLAKVAAFWFFKENRTMVCSILTLLNLVGTGIGFVLPTLIVSEDLFGDQAKQAMFNLMMTEAIPTFVLTLLVIILMKDKPEIAPSMGGMIQKMPFKQSVKVLAKNVNFMLVLIGFTMYYGPLATLSSLLNFLFKPFNFTDTQIAILGIFVIVSGLVGAIVISCYISRSNEFAKSLKILAILSVLLLTVGLLGLKFNFPFWSFGVIFSLLGLMITPLYAVSYDLGCETSFPVGEGQVTGILNAGGNLCAFILLLVIQTSIGFGTMEDSIMSFIVMLSLAIVGTGSYLLVKNILVRMEAEKKHHEEMASGNTLRAPNDGIQDEIVAQTAQVEA